MGKIGAIIGTCLWAFGGAVMAITGFRMLDECTDVLADQLSDCFNKKGNDIVDDPTSIN